MPDNSELLQTPNPNLMQDFVARYSEFISYSNFFNLADQMLQRAAPVDFSEIASYLQAISFAKKADQTVISLTQLKDPGFCIEKQRGNLYLWRPGEDVFAFDTEMISTRKQQIQSGWRNDNPVIIKEYGHQIDPYYAAYFLQWLVLQQLFHREELPVKDFAADLSHGTKLSMFTIDNSVYCSESTLITGTTGSIEVWGLGPCVGVAIGSRERRVGLITHITPLDQEISSVDLIERQLAQRNIAITDCTYVIGGGFSEDHDERSDSVDVIRDELNRRKARPVADLSGRGLSVLQINLDTMRVGYSFPSALDKLEYILL